MFGNGHNGPTINMLVCSYGRLHAVRCWLPKGMHAQQGPLLVGPELEKTAVHRQRRIAQLAVRMASIRRIRPGTQVLCGLPFRELETGRTHRGLDPVFHLSRIHDMREEPQIPHGNPTVQFCPKADSMHSGAFAGIYRSRAGGKRGTSQRCGKWLVAGMHVWLRSNGSSQIVQNNSASRLPA